MGAVLVRVFLKPPGGKTGPLQQPIRSNDFASMYFRQEFGKNGMKQREQSSFFANLMKKMPTLLEKRDIRKSTLTTKKKKKGKGKAPVKHQQRKGIAGRVKISIFYEELFVAMPKGAYASPLDLVLRTLE